MTFLFWLSALFTLAIFSSMVAEFLTHGRIHLDSTLTNAFYLAMLSAYVGPKEFLRWKREREMEGSSWRLPGEIFVGLWAVFLLVANYAAQLWPNRLVYPHGLTTVAFEVLGFYLGTSASKWLQRKDEQAEQEVRVSLEKEEPAAPERTAEEKPISAHGLKKRQAFEEKVLAKAQTQGHVTRDDVEALTGLGPTASWKLLRRLVEQGRLRQEGESGSKSTRYMSA
jgi:hypothetical protein